VLLGIFGIGEAAGGFDDDLRANRFPWNLGRIFFGEDLYGLTFNLDAVGGSGNILLEVAEDGVVFQKVGKSLRISEIVASYDVDISSFNDARKTLRPIRPNPLIATLTAISPPHRCLNPGI